MRTYNSTLKIENLAHLFKVLIWQRIQSSSTKDVSSYRSQATQWNSSLKSQTGRYCKTLPVASIFLSFCLRSFSFLVFPRKALRHCCTAIFVSSLINTSNSCSKLSPVFNIFGMPDGTSGTLCQKPDFYFSLNITLPSCFTCLMSECSGISNSSICCSCAWVMKASLMSSVAQRLSGTGMTWGWGWGWIGKSFHIDPREVMPPAVPEK